MRIVTSFDLDKLVLADSEAVKRTKRKSFERFLELGLPTRAHDAYQYEQLAPLYETKFEQALSGDVGQDAIADLVLPEYKTSYLVLVNGQFRPELSTIDAECVFLPLSQGFRTYSALLVNSHTKAMQENSNPFSLLNAAMHQEGLFAYIPPKKRVNLQLISIIDAAQECCWVMPRVHLFAGASSEVQIVHTKKAFATSNCFYNAVVDATLEDNAQVVFDQATVQECSGWFFEHFTCTLKRSALLRATFADTARWMRRDFTARLIGEGAEVDVRGVWLIDSEKEMHTNVHIDHKAPHSRSSQLFKGVLDGKAKSSFQGKIEVQKPAQKTESYQLSSTLLLSPQAESYAKPNLEIFADDVKASHGATVGQLDSEELFYLRSRGMPEDKARGTLIWGFCKEVVAKLSSSSVQREVEKQMKKGLFLPH